MRAVPTRRRAARRQGGFGLLEAIVSIGLVSTVILALASGLLTAIRSSDSARRTQEVDAALSAYAESFKSDYPSSFAGLCPVDGDFTGTAPAGFTAQVDKVEHWDGSDWSGSCAGPNPGIQRLTVRVTAADGDEATAEVVVRKP